MNLRPIIDDIAAQTDELLADHPDRARARVAIAEFVALEYPRLVAADRRLVTQHVLAILDTNGAFAESFVNSFEAEAPEPESDED